MYQVPRHVLDQIWVLGYFVASARHLSASLIDGVTIDTAMKWSTRWLSVSSRHDTILVIFYGDSNHWNVEISRMYHLDPIPNFHSGPCKQLSLLHSRLMGWKTRVRDRFFQVDWNDLMRGLFYTIASVDGWLGVQLHCELAFSKFLSAQRTRKEFDLETLMQMKTFKNWHLLDSP